MKRIENKRKFALYRVRKKSGSNKRYEVFLVRSRRNISSFLYDSSLNRVLAGCTSGSKEFISLCQKEGINRSSVKGSSLFASIFRKKILSTVSDFDGNSYFNRSIYKYHGRVKAFCEGLFVSSN